MSRSALFHVKHSPSGMKGKEKEYGAVHVQMDFENQAVWFVLSDKDGNFSSVPASACKEIKKE